jgi:hypothetical protein
MIKLKTILFEQEPTQKEDPDKILVVNKKSGEEYYISKNSYDPNKHRKPEESDSTKVEDSDKTSSEDKSSKESKDDKKSTPDETVEKAMTSVDFIKDKHKDDIIDVVPDLRPDLKKKLLNFNFSDFFREYDNAMLGVNSGDSELSKKSTKMILNIAKKIQAVSIAKHLTINTFSLSKEVIDSTKEYHNNAQRINKLLRDSYGKMKWSPEQIKAIFDKDLSAEELSKLEPIRAIFELDKYFKSDDSKLQYDVTVYRGIRNDVLKQFLKEKTWTDHAFVSTSINPLIAENFTEGGSFKPHMRDPLFKIELKQGDPALMLKCEEDDFCVETEITLPRNCKFTISGFDQKNNIYTLDVEFENAR